VQKDGVFVFGVLGLEGMSFALIETKGDNGFAIDDGRHNAGFDPIIVVLRQGEERFEKSGHELRDLK
jgi:hypothetical protein